MSLNRTRGPWRVLLILVFSVWFGGLTLYSLVVIPTAHAVLHSHARVGFITQSVTHWINAAGVSALLLLLGDLRAGRKDRVRLWTWIVMAAAQAALLALHPFLDGFLDPKTRDIAEPDRFYGFHRIYLLVTAVQWLAAIPQLWTLLKAWSSTPLEPAA
jgi:hypothetical protein